MIRKLALALMTAGVGALSACGGGDDGPSKPSAPAAAVPGEQPGTGGQDKKPGPPDDSPPPGTDGVSPACQDCGATAPGTYGGAGVGVWRYINASAKAVNVPVSIAGLSDKEVTLVFTNATATPQAMPAIPLTAKAATPSRLSTLQTTDQPAAELKRRIAAFNRDGWASMLGAPSATSHIAPSLSVRKGTVRDRRTWNDAENRPHEATLVRQLQASDGSVVNFWVEDGEHAPARVSEAILDRMADWLAGPGKLYDKLKSVGGPLWGPHPYAELIAGQGQPLNIVILNFKQDGNAYGVLGYFYSRDLFKRNAENVFGNEAVALYFDSETMYLGGEEGLKVMGNTLAHEAMHLQNMYRRGIGISAAHMFDVWLEEATAMMVEDFTGDIIDPTNNIIRDARFYSYITENGGMYNCNLTTWDTYNRACDPYAVAGSFGGFLNRQLGIDFYKNLLTSRASADSLRVLDSAIGSASGNSGFAEQFRRFTATSGSLMPALGVPAGYGFPARAERGFTLPVIDPRRLLARRTLLQTVPETLAPYASVPVVRQSVNGVYQETVAVPPGTLLSVVVQ